LPAAGLISAGPAAELDEAVILGADPIDPVNKSALTREEHIQAVRFWNKVIADVRQKERWGKKGKGNVGELGDSPRAARRPAPPGGAQAEQG
jgi:hypothetical protein